MELMQLIKARDVEGIRRYCATNGLCVRDGRIEPIDQEAKQRLLDRAEFFNSRQQARKIQLNIVYGALLNKALRFWDPRLGQSVTLSGRTIDRHMNAQINLLVCGKYDHTGDAIIYADTDSVAGDTMIRTNLGDKTVAELFDLCPIKWTHGGKEYAVDDTVMVTGYVDGIAKYSPISYVYRHRTSKRRFRITDSVGHSVVVTEDHSLMVERDAQLLAIKPTDLAIGDVLVTVMPR